MSDDTLWSPWTDEQVAGLNAFQASGRWHPFTCGNDDCRHGDPDPRSRYATLRATPDGWLCDWCGYRQDWALKGMPEIGMGA